MPIWLTLFLSLGGSTIISLIVTLVWNTFKDGTKKVKMKREQERRDEMRKVVRDETERLATRLDEVDKKLDNLQNGTLSSLRNSILFNCNACVYKGYKEPLDEENMESLLESYYRLGGNSYIHNTVEPTFRKLPTKSEYDLKHSKKQKIVEKYEG